MILLGILLFMHHWNLGYQTLSEPKERIQFPNEDYNSHNKFKQHVLSTCAILDKESSSDDKNVHLNSAPLKCSK